MKPTRSSEFSHSISRRTLLAGAAGAAAVAALKSSPLAQAQHGAPKVVLFSKHLGWTNYDELADLVGEIGFDGVDLTVRPGGHVLPERVQEDLPKATEAIRSAGLEVSMITTRIGNRETPHASDILATASELGIPFFRWGTFRYEDGKPRLQQLEEMRPPLQDLAGMAAHFGIRGGYHNHSGDDYVGAAIWDLVELLKGVDTEWLGSNFDIGHTFAEGSRGAWETNFELLAPIIKMSAVKDFAWVKREDRGWRGEFPALGEGIVRWNEILALMKNSGFNGPFSIHQEYGIPGGNEREKRTNIVKLLKKDLQFFRERLSDVGWV